MQGEEINRSEEVRQLAYKIWLEEGCPEGREVQNWLIAETKWLDEQRPKNKSKKTKPRKGKKQTSGAEKSHPDAA